MSGGARFRDLSPRVTERPAGRKVSARRGQEQDSFAQTGVGSAQDHPHFGIVGGLKKHFGSGGRGKKNGTIVLIDPFSREAGASFLPFDDLGVNGVEALVFQPLGGRAGGSHTTQPDTDEGSRSHDYILNLP